MSRTAPLNEANKACEPIGQSSLAINGKEQMVKKIDFTTNSIHSKFTDNPPVTQAASGLPQMQGLGWCEAARRRDSLLNREHVTQHS
jgi:hypothetical protein